MLTAKEASAIAKSNQQLRELLDKIETEIKTAAQRGYGGVTIKSVKEEQVYPVYRLLRECGYIVTQSKVRNNDGNYNLTICWE